MGGELVSFGLLCGHMLGDYILQNDWMAGNKANQHPGIDPWVVEGVNPHTGVTGQADIDNRIRIGQLYQQWSASRQRWLVGHLACTVHCLLYTFAVWLCSWWWMPWWGLVICFAAHWPLDRFGLAGWWMRNISGQEFFASKSHPMWPNGVVLVDNTFHLLTLFGIALLCFRA